MKRIILLTCGFVLIFSTAILADEKSFDIQGFTAIQFTTPGHLFLTQSNHTTISVSGPTKVIKDIVLKKQGDTLTIKKRWRLFGSHTEDWQRLKIMISLPTLSKVSTSSSGAVESLTPFTDVHHIALKTSSSGGLMMVVSADSIEAVSSSSGSIHINGQADQLQLNTSSDGDITFSGEVFSYLKAVSSSSGNITCEISPRTILARIVLKASSGGNIGISGQANHVEASASSSGNLLLKELICDSMKLRVSSSGMASVNVTGYLDAKTSSSGDVINHYTRWNIKKSV